MQDSSSVAVTPETVSADFVTRLIASLIDGAIIGIVPGIVVFMAMAIFTPLGMLFWLAWMAGSIGYNYYFWTTTGQTPGKKIMGLKVVRAEDGAILDQQTAIMRYVGYFVSSLVVYIGFLAILWDPQHDGWHDKIAKTKVIKVGTNFMDSQSA